MQLALEFVDKIERFVPSIKDPSRALSLREKMFWTGIIIVVYFMLYNIYALGVNSTAVNQPFLQLISIILLRKGRRGPCIARRGLAVHLLGEPVKYGVPIAFKIKRER